MISEGLSFIYIEHTTQKKTYCVMTMGLHVANNDVEIAVASFMGRKFGCRYFKQYGQVNTLATGYYSQACMI